MWEFMEGGFKLNDEIQFLADPKVKLAGLAYNDISREHPTIHARFTGRRLSVISIRTSDTDLIEDMFSRLNEAVPLNAAEKRNAFGGSLTSVIRDLVKHSFFTARLAIPSSRYRHYDLACRFLYLQDQGKPAETKKVTLDGFVKDFAKRELKEARPGIEGRNYGSAWRHATRVQCPRFPAEVARDCGRLLSALQ
jgi:hypothetical protein